MEKTQNELENMGLHFITLELIKATENLFNPEVIASKEKTEKAKRYQKLVTVEIHNNFIKI